MELLAIKWAMTTEVFKVYLMGNRCTVVTDHHPLLFLDKANLGCVEMRWVQQMSVFNFEIVYRPGKANQAPDALSRRNTPILDEPAVVVTSCIMRATFEVNSPGTQVPQAVCHHTEVNRQGGTPCLPGLSMQEIEVQQQADDVLHEVRGFVRRGTAPVRQERDQLWRDVLDLLKEWKRLSFEDGLLVRSVKSP